MNKKAVVKKPANENYVFFDFFCFVLSLLINIIKLFGKILKYFNDDVISRCSFIGNSLKLRQLFSGTASEFRMKMIITSPRKCKHAENLKSCLERTRHVKYALLR